MIHLEVFVTKIRKKTEKKTAENAAKTKRNMNICLIVGSVVRVNGLSKNKHTKVYQFNMDDLYI